MSYYRGKDLLHNGACSLSALVAGANVSVLIIHIDTGTGKTSRGNKAIILMPKKNMIE